MPHGITFEEYLERDQNRHFNYVANGAVGYFDDNTPEGRLNLTAFLQTLDIIRKNSQVGEKEPPSLYEKFKPKECARCGRVDERKIAEHVVELLKTQKVKCTVKKRHYKKLTMAALKRVAEIWNSYRFNADKIKVEKGRKVRKYDVFQHFRAELEKMGIMNEDDFARAIDNARKQFPELFPEKRQSRKKSSSR